MRSWIVKLSWIVPILFITVSLSAQQSTSTRSGQSLTLREAVNLALQGNPMVEISEAGLEAADARVGEAEAARLPGLKFSEMFMNSNNPVYVFGKLLEQGRFSESNFDPNFLNSPGSLSNFRSSLNLQIPVFNRFQIASQVEQAKSGRTQAARESDWIRQQIRMQVVEAYYGVVVSRERMAVAREAVETAEQEVESIRAKVEQGVAVSSDLLAMEVQLADFRQQLVEAEGEAETALAALNTVLAQDVATPRDLVETLEQKQFSTEARPSLISTALMNRPDYLSAEEQIRIAEQKVHAARGDYWPDLNLFAEYGLSGQDLASGSADFAVGASLNFDIVDFGRSPRIRQAVAGSRAAQARKRQTGNMIRMEVVQAYQKFLSSEQRLELASKAVEQAEEVLRIVQDRHDVGLTTITEVLRSQTAHLRARMNLLGARYQYYLGYARVRLSTGTLTDVGPFTN